MPLPTVRKRPRTRNHDGTWRKKRSDAGKQRGKNMNWEHMPDAVKDWIDSFGWSRQEIEQIDMHRLTTEAVADNNQFVTCITTKYVYVIVRSTLGARIEKLFDNSVDGWKLAEFDEEKAIFIRQFAIERGEGWKIAQFDEKKGENKTQFEKASMHIIGLVCDNTLDSDKLSDFLCKFARHIVENVGCEDLDRLTVEEIVERMPDMEVME